MSVSSTARRGPRFGLSALALIAFVILAPAGCGGAGAGGGDGDAARSGGSSATASPDPGRAAGVDSTAPSEPEGAAGDAEATGPGRVHVEPARCPAGHPACRVTTGRILYVERIDPYGDGDAHFVVLDPQGITLPGLTAIDVRAGLRPHPLPGIGDLVSAAGPVQTGSYGQDQIHALSLNVGGPG